MADRYLGYKTKRYGTTYEGHEIELEFDKKLMVLNRARLLIDGAVVDRENIFYGDHDLTATLPDSTSVKVTVDSGMVGELTRAQLHRTDGTWVDLVEREPRS